ncbi:hypothetical protein NW757_007164 [Fusarium falciforme]|nr:hypothetical protein NW757_007164 [Fusarium falciforme]
MIGSLGRLWGSDSGKKNRDSLPLTWKTKAWTLERYPCSGGWRKVYLVLECGEVTRVSMDAILTALLAAMPQARWPALSYKHQPRHPSSLDSTLRLSNNNIIW